MPSWSDFIATLKNEGESDNPVSEEAPKPKPASKRTHNKPKLNPEEEEKRRYLFTKKCMGFSSMDTFSLIDSSICWVYIQIKTRSSRKTTTRDA
jgi:hypothetical protein